MTLALVIDILVILIVLVSAGVAFFRGFVREVLTIFGVIGGFLAAFFFGQSITPIFRSWFGVADGQKVDKLFDLIPYTIVSDICAYAAIFISVFLILQLISHFMSATIRAVGLGALDRSLGVVFGIVRGVLVVGILFLPFNAILPEENKREWFGKSNTYVYVEMVSDWLKTFLPSNSDEAKEKVQSFSREKVKSVADQVVEKELNNLKQVTKEKTSGYTTQVRNKLDNLIEDEAMPEQPNADQYNNDLSEIPLNR